MPMGIGPGLSVTRGGSVTGIGAIGADLALWFDENQAYKSSGGGIVTPDSILTYTAPSPKLVYGSDGVLGYAPHNLLLRSEEFGTSPWQVNSSISVNDGVAPDGTMTADLLTPTANDQAAGQTVSGLSQINGVTYTFSVWMKAEIAHTATLRMFEGGAAGGATVVNVNVTTEWQRFSLTTTWAVSGTSIRVFLYPKQFGTGNPNLSVLAWGAQLNLGSSALTYVPTTTAVSYSLPRDHNPTTGAALGVLVEEARTNLLLWSSDLTQAAWTPTNLTTAKTATGPDGVANSASTLTATAANATARQDITSASAARITSMFVKRRTGTGAVTLSQGQTTGSELLVAGSWSLSINGGTGTATESPSGTLNLTGDATNPATADQSFSTVVGTVYRIGATVATNTASLSVGTTQGGTDNFTATVATGTPTATAMTFVATATTTWVRFFKTQAAATVVSAISCKAVVETTVTVTSSWTRVATASATVTNPIVLVKLATSGDAIDVALFQIENGAFITSPIATTNNPLGVTRAADQVSILTSAFPYSATESTLVETRIYNAITSSYIYLTNISAAGGVANIFSFISNAGNASFRVRSGAVDQVDESYASLTLSGQKTLAAAVKANDFAFIAQGGVLKTDSSGLMPVGVVALNLSGFGLNSHIKRLDYYAVRKTNAELQVLST
jgi:hypothetical protein